jgi:hypothetical protein
MGAMYFSLETLITQPGQIAGVVNVSVGEKNSIYLSRRNGKGLPISQPIFL